MYTESIFFYFSVNKRKYLNSYSSSITFPVYKREGKKYASCICEIAHMPPLSSHDFPLFPLLFPLQIIITDPLPIITILVVVIIIAVIIIIN